MGLDITVLGTPLRGHEDEFHDLLVTLSVDAGVMADPRPAPGQGLLQRLLGKGGASLSPRDREVRLARFPAIQTQPYALPGAQLHIVDSLPRWAVFWGSWGHGSYPDF